MSAAARRRRRARPAGPPDVEPTPERLRRGEIRAETVFVADPPGDGRPRPQRVRRDAAAGVRGRLWRFRDLSPAQLAAAERLERDWALAQLEPRLVVTLGAPSRGPGWAGPAEARAKVLDARGRVQSARQALRRGGEDVLRVVEGIVMYGQTAEALGGSAHGVRRDASVRLRALLGVGLNLLADAYGVAGSRS